MKRYIHVFYAIMVSVILLSSCLSSADEGTVVVYDDTALTAFRLTTVNRYLHTTSKSGKDSVYKKTLSNPVVFNIDQTAYEIYNNDSLPYGSDVKHVLASITSKSSTPIFYKSFVGDTLFSYRATDSIDFSQPREFRVYNNTGTIFRTYTVTVNVHQAEAGKLVWEKQPSEAYPVDTIWAYWEQKVEDAGLESFIGAGRKEAYAFSADHQIMVTRDNGATWQIDSIGDDASLLPQENVRFISYPFAPNDDTDYQVMTGTISEGEVINIVWRKIAEYSDDSRPSKWVSIPYELYNKYYLPAMSDYSLVYFHNHMLAIDASRILISRDGGITWKESDSYKLPEGTFYNIEATTDADGNLWFMDEETDEVWRGKLIDK